LMLVCDVLRYKVAVEKETKVTADKGVKNDWILKDDWSVAQVAKCINAIHNSTHERNVDGEKLCRRIDGLGLVEAVIYQHFTTDVFKRFEILFLILIYICSSCTFWNILSHQSTCQAVTKNCFIVSYVQDDVYRVVYHLSFTNHLLPQQTEIKTVTMLQISIFSSSPRRCWKRPSPLI
jgi:hypothetical protein